MISSTLSTRKGDAGEGRTRGLKAAAHPRTRAATGLRKRVINRRISEGTIQQVVFEHLRKRGAAGLVAFHPKNGGLHQSIAGWRIRNFKLGVEPGIPDVIVAHDCKTYALELKTVEAKASEEQEIILIKLRAAGWICGVAYGIDEAIAWLERNGLLRGRVG